MDPFFATTGPLNARIALVLESHGEEEEKHGSALAGATGYYVNSVLPKVLNIPRSSVFCTNVVAARPPNNEMHRFFRPAGSAGALRGLYPSPTVLQGLENLRIQLAEVQPELVIACGNYAAWALTADSFTIKNGKGPAQGIKVPRGIDEFRGSQATTLPEYGSRKCLLVYHPANCLYPCEARYLFEFDLRKRVPLAFKPGAWNESPSLTLDYQPSYRTCNEYLRELLANADNNPPVWVAVDIETFLGEIISCIGFSASVNHAICIPFLRSATKAVFNRDEELNLKLLIHAVLSHRNIRIIGQNFKYDATFLEDEGLACNRVADWDTYSIQTLLNPGHRRSLSYLASIYCKFYRYWKQDADVKEWNPKTVPPEEVWLYNTRDVVNDFEIAMRQMKEVRDRPGFWQKYEDRLLMSRIAYQMGRQGVLTDRSIALSQYTALTEAYNSRVSFLDSCIPNATYFETKSAPWWNSSAKQKEIFYRRLGIKPELTSRGKKSDPTETFGWKAIQAILEREPWLSCILTPLAELGSIKGAMRVIEQGVDEDNRLRTEYNADGTETFRFSSGIPQKGKGTNMQNLTEGTE